MTTLILVNSFCQIGTRELECEGLQYQAGGNHMDDMILIYTHPDCTYSDAAKDELQRADVPFKEIDLSINPEAWEEVERLTGGERMTLFNQ